VASAVLLIGGLTAVALIRRLVAGRPDGATSASLAWAARVRWDDPIAIAVSGILLLLGFSLLLIAVLPGRRDLLKVEPGRSGATAGGAVEVVVPRRTVRGLLTSRVGEIDGVDSVDVEVDERQVAVRAGTAIRSAQEVHDAVTDTVRLAVADLALRPEPRVRTGVRQHD
jgi:hypothetical protein